MKNPLKFLLFTGRPLFVRIWMWSAIVALIYYISVAIAGGRYLHEITDIYVMAYGLFSIALYVLVYGFDWK